MQTKSYKKRIITTTTLAATAALAMSIVTIQSRQLQPANKTLTYKAQVKTDKSKETFTITSNGIPDHKVGQFPGKGNPNAIRPQSYTFNIPLNPTVNKSQNTSRRPGPRSLFGVAINGVPFDPGTAELWNNDRRWHYEALSGQLANGLGLDSNRAHVQPTGAYHYHGLPTDLLEKLDYKKQPTLIGWAADGFPVYANYGYSNPKDPNSTITKLNSSYKLKSGNRPDGPPGPYDGSFAQDFTYSPNHGDLDEYNGRTGVTPEYPQGTYYYVLTETFPFIPRKLKGTPDPSFSKRPPMRPPSQEEPDETTSHSHGNHFHTH